MKAHRIAWGGGYEVSYNASAGDGTLVVTFPGNHRIRGPIGTLVGLRDLVHRVLAAVDKGAEEVVIGQYAWPPNGMFLSRTHLVRMGTPLGRILHARSGVSGDGWSAEMWWLGEGANYYNAASVGIELWRQLAAALDNLWRQEGVEELELRFAQQTT